MTHDCLADLDAPITRPLVGEWVTPAKFNLAPEKGPFQEETRLPRGYVKLQECTSYHDLSSTKNPSRNPQNKCPCVGAKESK